MHWLEASRAPGGHVTTRLPLLSLWEREGSSLLGTPLHDVGVADLLELGLEELLEIVGVARDEDTRREHAALGLEVPAGGERELDDADRRVVVRRDVERRIERGLRVDFSAGDSQTCLCIMRASSRVGHGTAQAPQSANHLGFLCSFSSMSFWSAELSSKTQVTA